MRKWGLLVALLACAAVRARGDETRYADTAHYKTVAVIEDVTDPATPVELWRGENLLTVCGVLNLMAPAISGSFSSMPDAMGSWATYCGGTNAGGQDKTACAYAPGSASIVVGAGGAENCTSAGVPFACCTGNGTGCAAAWAGDMILYAQNQPDQTLVGAEGNFGAWANGGKANAAQIPTSPSYSGPYYDAGANKAGVTFRATADGSTANFKWCEWGVTSARTSGCGFSNSAGTEMAGWLLNHAMITPCLGPKVSNAIWQITVTITIA